MLQTGTKLPETDLSSDFIRMGWNNDVYAISRSNTSSDTTRLYVFNHASHYKTISMHHIQCLPKTDHKFAFTLGWNLNLFVIQKTCIISGKTHVQVLTTSPQHHDSPLQYITKFPDIDSTCSTKLNARCCVVQQDWQLGSLIVDNAHVELNAIA